MAHIKVYVDIAEEKEINKLAKEKKLSKSSFIRTKLGLPEEVSDFSRILAEVINLAENLPLGTEFSVPDLYTAIKWNEITSTVGAGVLGKRFYEKVAAGMVNGVVPLHKIKNRRELYLKV